MSKPYFEADGITLYHGDCLDVLRAIPDESVDAVVTDPPYFRVVDEPWDRQWDTAEGFTNWLTEVTRELHRVLVPNGTIYIFASPQMAARVELHVLDRSGFLVLNRVVWHKTRSHIGRANRDGLTQYHSADNERILVGQPVKRDGDQQDAFRAYANALDAARAQVFKPLIDYMVEERDRAGWTNPQINKATGTDMAGHWFSTSQWTLPTRENYAKLRQLFNSASGDDYLRRDYDYLRRDYEDLRRDYEDLRRPFDLGPELPHRPRGEVWQFAPVLGSEKGQHAHPCEKPQLLLEHIVATSTREGQTVLDAFVGSGAVGVASVNLRRNFIGIEKSDKWVDAARRWIVAADQNRQETLL